MTATIDAGLVHSWMSHAAVALHDACPLLTELDAARGDADHGYNMDRGFRAISDALDAAPSVTAEQALLTSAAVLRKTMGGTTGPLWATALRRIGKALGPGDPATPEQLAAALQAAGDGVADIGEAREGDNTMLDAIYPAARALHAGVAAGDGLLVALQAAATAATSGAQATAERAATKGRASYLGDRAIGKPDPGATSAAIVIVALYDAAVDDADHPPAPNTPPPTLPTGSHQQDATT